MPAIRRHRPQVRGNLITRSVDATVEGDVSRAFDEVHSAIARVEQRTKDRVVLTVDLAVGVNRVNHQLGRKPLGCTVTPTTADASFAWAMTDASTTQLVITTVGVVQTNAVLEVF